MSDRVESDDSSVAAKTSGRIHEITVREGDTVKAGQVIAVLGMADGADAVIFRTTAALERVQAARRQTGLVDVAEVAPAIRAVHLGSHRAVAAID